MLSWRCCAPGRALVQQANKIGFIGFARGKSQISVMLNGFPHKSVQEFSADRRRN
jgi:hypothetical protein